MQNQTVTADAAEAAEAAEAAILKNFLKQKQNAFVGVFVAAAIAIATIIITSTSTDARDDCGDAIWIHMLIYTILYSLSTITFGLLYYMFELYTDMDVRFLSDVISIDAIHTIVQHAISIPMFIWTLFIFYGTDSECKSHFQDKHLHLWNMIKAITIIGFISIGVNLINLMVIFIKQYKNRANSQSISSNAVANTADLEANTAA